MKKEIGKPPSPRTLGLKNEGTFQRVGELKKKSPAVQKEPPTATELLGDAERATTPQKARKGEERTRRVRFSYPKGSPVDPGVEARQAGSRSFMVNSARPRITPDTFTPPLIGVEALYKAPVLKADRSKITFQAGDKVLKLGLYPLVAELFEPNVRGGRWITLMKLPHVLAPFMDTQTLSCDQAKVVIGKIEKTDPDNYKDLKEALDTLESEGKPVPCISSGAAPGKTASELIWRQELQIGAKKNKKIVDDAGEFSPDEFIDLFQENFRIVLPKELQLLRKGESDAEEEEFDDDWIKKVDKYLSSYQPENRQALQYKIELLSVLVLLEAPSAMAGQKDEENANKLAQDFANWLATPEGSKAMIRMACADVLIGMPDRIVGNTHTGNFSWDGSKSLVH